MAVMEGKTGKSKRGDGRQENMWPLQRWLQDNNIPHRTFYHWLDRGLAPRVTKIGRRVYIQAVDDAAWREELRTRQDRPAVA
jgi:hypothetical protein